VLRTSLQACYEQYDTLSKWIEKHF
jgi:hypothetical protein